MKSHLLTHPARAKKKTPASPQWPSFTGTATLIGTSPTGKVNVFYDATLGAEALANAQALLTAADSVVAFDSATFGNPDGVANVIVFALGGATDGTGGADHMGCDFSTGENIEVDASYGRNDRVIALFEAELSECQMNGSLCGYSTGEALSRWCSMMVPGSNNALADFASAPTWQQDGLANWVDQTEPTDGDYDSIGCGMAFLSWLIGKKGYTLPQIAQTMVALGDNGTLASLYERLSGTTSSPWSAFLADVQALGSITSDDPFGGMSNPAPAPAPTPTPPPPAPSPSPSPSPSPAPMPSPTPVSGIMALIDGAFAQAIQDASGNALEVLILQTLQKWIDEELPLLLQAAEGALSQFVIGRIQAKLGNEPWIKLAASSVWGNRALQPGTLLTILQTLLQDAPQVTQEITQLVQQIVKMIQGG